MMINLKKLNFMMSAGKQQKRKICMLGAFAVGKTSLVEQFVHSIYSDAYHTTVGVKIDKKIVQIEDTELTCVIWDIAGEDEFYTVSNTYLRGMAGFFLVIDCTRKSTLKIALNILERVRAIHPKIPFVVLLNKTDLVDEREISLEDLAELEQQSVTLIETSAKQGQGVEDAFKTLAAELIGHDS